MRHSQFKTLLVVVLASSLLSVPVCLNAPVLLSFLAQATIMVVACCSYQLLFGQAGLFSFGHAIFFGLAAFSTIHCLNRWHFLPIVYLPLIAGVVVASLACLIGLVSCRSSNTVFSMISLALAELLSASTLMLPGLFGGEAGISGNRVRDFTWLGWNFASQNQMTGLILVLGLLSVLAMYAWQFTPLGRLALAVRDNPTRLGFTGFNPHWVKILCLMTAAFFAGVAGSLNALQYELASAENLGLQRSGLILLFTVIGGTQHMSGAILGALCGVLFSSYLSDWSPAWSLYLGLFFVFVVRFQPGGLLAVCQQIAHFSRNLLRLPVVYAGKLLLLHLVRTIAALFAQILLIEFLYQRNLQTDSVWHGLYTTWDTARWSSWLWPLFLVIVASFAHWLLSRVKCPIAPASTTPVEGSHD